MSKTRLFLGYESAFWIWRKAGPMAFTALGQSRVRSLVGGAPTRAKIEAFRKEHPDLMTDPIEVIVRYGGQRKIPGVKTHVRSSEFPDRSFYCLDDDVLVASPELCLMQLAAKLDEPQAAKLALEMCGTYAIEPYGYEPGFVKRPPLTSARKLTQYANRLYVPESRAKGAHFLRYVVDDSASPRETALCLLLCLPRRFGGYGIALPELNKRIELSLEEQLMMGVHYFVCDLYWAESRVAVEYDSAEHHTEAEKQERDAIRRNMLEHKGIRVITATRKQLNSAAEFDKLAHQIARAVGKRMRTPDKAQIAARDELRKTLLNWDLFEDEDDGLLPG